MLDSSSHYGDDRMKKEIYIGAWIGLKTGIASMVIYMFVATILDFLSMKFFWGPSLTNVVRILTNNLINFTAFLIIPFGCICTTTGIIFVFILKTKSNLDESYFTAICLTICLIIALVLYRLTTNMIYNIDKESMQLANIEFRTIPYILFVFWGYFASRKIYRTIRLSSNDTSTSS